MRATAYLKAIMEVYGEKVQVLALKKNIRPVLLDTLAAMYVCDLLYVLMHCFYFSKSNNDFSFQNVYFLKILLRLQKKSLISR